MRVFFRTRGAYVGGGYTSREYYYYYYCPFVPRISNHHYWWVDVGAFSFCRAGCFRFQSTSNSLHISFPITTNLPLFVYLSFYLSLFTFHTSSEGFETSTK
nr:hypothetical protein Q903MT_gene3206 [Picea sitchensis]